MNTRVLFDTAALTVVPATEHLDCADGTVTIAVVVDDRGLVVVLRAMADPDVAVRVPVSNSDAEHLTRALAGSLRYLNQARGCPACDPRWAES